MAASAGASEANEQVFTCRYTRARVRWLAPRAVRVTHIPLPETDFPPDRPWLENILLPQSAGSLPENETPTGGIKSGFSQNAFDIFTSKTHAGGLTFAYQNIWFAEEPQPQFSHGFWAFGLPYRCGESYYGLGEWFNAFARTRGKVSLTARESPAFAQGRQTYSVIPYLLSKYRYAIFLLNSFPSQWSFEPHRKVVRVRVEGSVLDYLLIMGQPAEILQTYTALTGRPPLPPRWAFGLWGTSYPQERQETTLARVEEHRRRKIPLDALILDYHWEERFHNFRWRKSLFPDPDAFVTRLKELGVRLGLIFTPFVNNRSLVLQKKLLNLIAKDISRGVENDDERALPEYEQTLAGGYLAHPQAKWWFGSGGMVDFSNPAAADWWNGLLRPLYRQGAAFFKNDDGEYLPLQATSALGMNGREYHNLYGFFYGRAIYEGMARLDDRRPLIYARSVWAGSQRYPAVFLGDQKPTFAHLRQTLRAGLNMSLLGFAYWTADTFGLDGKTNPETHTRYAQWTLFAPIARYFWRPPEIDATRFPWSHAGYSEASFRRHVELRYRLLPYYYSLAWQAYRTGLPILRPLFLEFPADDRAWTVEDQVMLGDRLMLAPVTQPGAARRLVALPAGTWYNFWTDQIHSGGGEIDIPAPLDQLPLLVRSGAILPLGPALDHIPDDHHFDTLEIHFWPPFNGSLDLYDDDGATRAYQSGQYSLTRISAQSLPGQIMVDIQPAEGGFPGHSPERTYTLVFHHLPRPESASLNAAETACQWIPDTRQASLTFQQPIHAAARIHLVLLPGGGRS